MAEIKFRKKKLKDDITMLESGFKHRAEKVQSYIPVSINPIDTIRKHPFRALSIAIASGLVLGLSSSKKRSKNEKEETGHSSKSDAGLTSLFIYELKRLAASRAVSYISDVIDQKVDKNN